MRYELTDLRVFHAICQEGNVSRGAARCHLSPSSASLRIKGLEEALGTALFVRHARGVVPTAAGEIMLEHVQRCVAGLVQMEADLAPFAQGLSGRLTVLANNNVLHSFLPQDLAAFLASYPDIRIHLQERMGTDIIPAVAEGRADVGIVAVDSDHPQLSFYPYREDHFVVLLPRRHAFSQHRSLRFSDCLNHPFISLQTGTALHTYLTNQAALLGGRLDVRVQVTGFGAIAALVASGAGLAILPRSVVTPQDEEHTVIATLDEPWALRQHRVCVKRDAPRHWLREQFVAQLCPGATAVG
ncbi:LysR family transcriptional regulator [Achromobacter spanius]|uniref:LysR family transcriptional regulator n=1 Tax=Achromobacter spanius TaxID=217203 RepID=A0AA42LKY9_9BURK|nr:LysR family transcriptional regulator [Achromobacter spanius]MDH0735704.1 LysR family transcriptional regulator [Achromobacter spanius]